MAPACHAESWPASMRAGINGEYEKRPNPIPINNVAPPAIERRNHTKEKEELSGAIVTN